MARVFISHSSRDNEAAGWVKNWLKEQGFDTPFLDFDKHAGIPPGADWERTLYHELERCEAVVIVQTANWQESKWCFAEFTQARALGKPVFPVIVDATDSQRVAPDVQSVSLTDDHEAGLMQLASELTRIALDSHRGFEWDDSRSPYPGLLTFQEEDAAVYFGRDGDIRRMIERLNLRRTIGGARLITLLGASGAGKSSLLRAGVIPRLRRASREWIILPTVRPQAMPMEGLVRSLAIASGRDRQTLLKALTGPDCLRALRDLASDLRIRAAANEAQILLPIDQAEELFGSSDDVAAAQFMKTLNAMLDPALPILAVLAMRSDFLGQLQSADALKVPFDEFSLAPLPLSQIPEIIEGPARVAGLTVDNAFVHRATKEAQTEDALPLLAFALREIFDWSADDGHLSLQDYEALGNKALGLTPLENAVRRAADNVIKDADPSSEVLNSLREAFIPEMVRVNDNGEYTRRRAKWSDLPERAHGLLERLASARLLVVSQEDDEKMVEVAHEAMLRKWPRLRRWLDEAREFIAGRQQLEVDLFEWENASKQDKPKALLKGLKLSRARAWSNERSKQLTEKQLLFIHLSAKQADVEEQSRREEDARRLRDAQAVAEANRLTVRRTRLGLVAATLLAAVAVVAGTFAYTQQINAQEQAADALRASAAADVARLLAEDRRQEAEANSRATFAALSDLALAEGKHLEAFILAMNSLPPSVDADVSKSVASRIFDIANGFAESIRLEGHEAPVLAAVFSPDGKSAMTTSSDGTARFWDTETGTEIQTVEGMITTARRAAYDALGARVVIGLNDGTTRVLDTSTGAEILTIQAHNDMVLSATFSNDGQYIATTSRSGEAKILVADNGQELHVLPVSHTDVWSAAFSPNGEEFVTGSHDGFIRVWSVASGEELRKFRAEANVFSVSFSPNGDLILYGTDDRKAHILDALTGAPVMLFPDHEGWVHDVAFSPNGRWVATSSRDGYVRIWDSESGENILSLGGDGGRLYGIDFSPDGKRIIASARDNHARIWALSDAYGAEAIRWLCAQISHRLEIAVLEVEKEYELSANQVCTEQQKSLTLEPIYDNF